MNKVHILTSNGPRQENWGLKFLPFGSTCGDQSLWCCGELTFNSDPAFESVLWEGTSYINMICDEGDWIVSGSWGLRASTTTTRWENIKRSPDQSLPIGWDASCSLKCWEVIQSLSWQKVHHFSSSIPLRILLRSHRSQPYSSYSRQRLGTWTLQRRTVSICKVLQIWTGKDIKWKKSNFP